MTIGLCTAAIGGLYEELDDATARATLAAAWAAGIRYFDTAPHYGAGVAERRLGAFLREKPRHEFTVSTKVGRLLRSGTRVRDYSATGVYTSLAESLDRTGLSRFDTLFIHDHWEAAVNAAYPALAKLRAEGVVGTIGVGMNQVEMLTFNSGVLADPGPDAHFDYQPVPPQIRRRVDELAAVCARHGVALPAAALRFPLRHKAVTSVVTGARTPAEVEANAAHLATEIPDALWAELDS